MKRTSLPCLEPRKGYGTKVTGRSCQRANTKPKSGSKQRFERLMKRAQSPVDYNALLICISSMFSKGQTRQGPLEDALFCSTSLSSTDSNMRTLPQKDARLALYIDAPFAFRHKSFSARSCQSLSSSQNRRCPPPPVDHEASAAARIAGPPALTRGASRGLPRSQ
jgi:hypothetical protein